MTCRRTPSRRGHYRGEVCPLEKVLPDAMKSLATLCGTQTFLISNPLCATSVATRTCRRLSTTQQEKYAKTPKGMLLGWFYVKTNKNQPKSIPLVVQKHVDVDCLLKLAMRFVKSKFLSCRARNFSECFGRSWSFKCQWKQKPVAWTVVH